VLGALEEEGGVPGRRRWRWRTGVDVKGGAGGCGGGRGGKEMVVGERGGNHKTFNFHQGLTG
jgi:hypothetical protein